MRIGIDLGGTKTEVILLSEKGEELYRKRAPTPKDDYHGIINTIKTLIEGAEAPYTKTISVGVGIPGVERGNGLIKNANTTILIDKPFRRDLESALDRPIRIENDANCFTLSEATDGAAEGEKVVFGVILGTGCGGGIVANGQVLKGRNLIAGEWGHNPLAAPKEEERPGPLCYCGKRGCNELFLSGTGFALDYYEATGLRLDGKSIEQRAKSGEQAAGLCLLRLKDRLARSLSVVINLLDPDCIVLGGGVSNIESLYEDIPRLWLPHVFSDTVETRLCKAKYKDSSGVRGAAWLWENGEYRS